MLEILPLLVFTTLGGISAGAYAVRAIGIAANNDGVNTPNDTQSRDWIFPLTCIVLLGVGLLGDTYAFGTAFSFLEWHVESCFDDFSRILLGCCLWNCFGC